MTEPQATRTKLQCGCPDVVGAGADEGEYCDDCHQVVRHRPSAYFNDTPLRVIAYARVGDEACVSVEWPNTDRSWLGQGEVLDAPRSQGGTPIDLVERYGQ